jgi:hypothetical protein
MDYEGLAVLCLIIWICMMVGGVLGIALSDTKGKVYRFFGEIFLGFGMICVVLYLGVFILGMAAGL